MSQKSYDKTPTLYLVPTPIGNMEDITLRAVNILKNSEVIFSEDTRETLKLIKYLDINKKLIACHKFNEDKIYEKILEYLNNGLTVALVSDRGTPAISDPGYVSAYNIIKNNYNVVCLPGATAFVPALVMSGINPNKFLFYGFLESKKSTKRKELEKLKKEKNTIIFYESPYRICETLILIRELFGDRNISVSREISKKYEEIYRGTVTNVLEELVEPKGEFVLVIEGNKEKESYDNIPILDHINIFMNEGLTEKDAIKKVSKLHSVEKNQVYMEYHGGKKWN